MSESLILVLQSGKNSSLKFSANLLSNELIKLKPGTTILVSSAAGAVGSMVCQFAKIKGCNVVGIAGGKSKSKYVVESLGFDSCIDYKEANLVNELKIFISNQ